MKVLGGGPGVGVLGQEFGCVSLGGESGGMRPGVPVQGREYGSESRGWGVQRWEFWGGSFWVVVLGWGFLGSGSGVVVLAHFRIYSQMIFMLNNQVSYVIMKWRPTDQPTDRPTYRWTDRASYRDMRTHLKMVLKDVKWKSEFFKILYSETSLVQTRLLQKPHS